jgi:hypothetical protein
MIRQVCRGDTWDFSAGTIEGMILKDRIGGGCGFIAQYNDTAENRELYHHALTAGREVPNFLFQSFIGIVVSICFWSVGFLIVYPFYHRIKYGNWPQRFDK